MTSTTKLTWGYICTFGGMLLVIAGIPLSAVCIGVPMIIIGLPVVIVGIILIFKGKSQKAQEIITAGVQQGIQAASRKQELPPKKPSN